MNEVASDTTRPSLLLRVRDHRDQAAWHLFVQTYAPLVYRFCRRKGLQDADAADVGQEVLTRVAQALRTFEYQPERGRFRSWLGTVVRSHLANYFKRKAREVPCVPDGGLDGAAGDDGDSEWAAHFNAQLLQTALERIRPDFEAETWRAFTLVWVESRPPAEVAVTLRMAPSRVYNARWRVLEKLRAEVLALSDDVPHLLPPHHDGA
jgi:RNA polymerase sigma-70 factor (ECF subfamily)